MSDHIYGDVLRVSAHYGVLMSLPDHIRLALLRGEDQRLHNQIAGGYAKGNYAAKARSRQREVRDAIRRLEDRR